MKKSKRISCSMTKLSKKNHDVVNENDDDPKKPPPNSSEDDNEASNNCLLLASLPRQLKKLKCRLNCRARSSNRSSDDPQLQHFIQQEEPQTPTFEPSFQQQQQQSSHEQEITEQHVDRLPSSNQTLNKYGLLRIIDDSESEDETMYIHSISSSSTHDDTREEDSHCFNGRDHHHPYIMINSYSKEMRHAALAQSHRSQYHSRSNDFHQQEKKEFHQSCSKENNPISLSSMTCSFLSDGNKLSTSFDLTNVRNRTRLRLFPDKEEEKRPNETTKCTIHVPFSDSTMASSPSSQKKSTLPIGTNPKRNGIRAMTASSTTSWPRNYNNSQRLFALASVAVCFGSMALRLLCCSWCDRQYLLFYNGKWVSHLSIISSLLTYFCAITVVYEMLTQPNHSWLSFSWRRTQSTKLLLDATHKTFSRQILFERQKAARLKSKHLSLQAQRRLLERRTRLLQQLYERSQEIRRRQHEHVVCAAVSVLQMHSFPTLVVVTDPNSLVIENSTTSPLPHRHLQSFTSSDTLSFDQKRKFKKTELLHRLLVSSPRTSSCAGAGTIHSVALQRLKQHWDRIPGVQVVLPVNNNKQIKDTSISLNVFIRRALDPCKADFVIYHMPSLPLPTATIVQNLN